MNQELLQTMEEFIKYVYSFYGKNGIYPMKATISIIKKATKIHIARVELDGNEFLADSICLFDFFSSNFSRFNSFANS